MSEQEFLTTIKVMAEKISMLEWQLKSAEESYNRALEANSRELADAQKEIQMLGEEIFKLNMERRELLKQMQDKEAVASE